MPALVAIRFNAPLKATYLALRQAGKPAKVAIVAVMCKLLVMANALLRDNRMWTAEPAHAWGAIPPPRRGCFPVRPTRRFPVPAIQFTGTARRPRQGWPKAAALAARSVLYAAHVRQPGGESPLCNLMEVKHE